MSLFSHSLHHLRTLLLFVGLTLSLGSCSATDLLLGGAKAALGSGPSVNAQVGKENVQGVKVVRQAPTATVSGPVDTVDQSTTNNTEVDPWLILLLIIGWLAPSPGEIVRGITKIFRRE